MPCVHCGSDLECLYVLEWLGGGTDGLDAVSDVPRAPGALLVAVPFSCTTVAVADIPLRTGLVFAIDPVLWNTTLLSMLTRRRERCPCLAYEDGPVFDWISRGVFDALGRLDKGSRLSDDDDRIAETEFDGRLTAFHTHYARLRIKIQCATKTRACPVETSVYHNPSDPTVI